ncbi:MAG: cytochrome c [Acidobacteria bacterium]|nr:cytochrome c [Acidobacteriota bacterium]
MKSNRRRLRPESEWGPTSPDKCRPKRLKHLVVILCALAFVAGCRQDMHNQPKYEPLEPSQLFADGSSARHPVEGTVPRGLVNADEALFTGKAGGTAVKEMPFAITAADLDRGQQRFNIYCTPCHDQSGNGNGMVVQRGYRKPPSFHIDRLKQADPGYMFDVISNGFGAMPDYKAQIDVRDRWRIVAYVKALQMAPGAGAPDATDSLPTPVGPPGAQPQPGAGSAKPAGAQPAGRGRGAGSGG